MERSDRVARDLLVGEVILDQFRDLGVTVIEAASGNELTAVDADSTKILIRQILGAVSNRFIPIRLQNRSWLNPSHPMYLRWRRGKPWLPPPNSASVCQQS